MRLCPECSDKLNYKTQKRQAKKESKKRKRKEESESEDEREDDSRGKRSKQASSEDEDGEHEEKHAKGKWQLEKICFTFTRLYSLQTKHPLFGANLLKREKKSLKKKNTKITLQTSCSRYPQASIVYSIFRP